MDTRTLYKSDGDRWLYWEVTWEGCELEIAEGEVGDEQEQEGDTITRSFSSPLDVSRFVKAQLDRRKALGFTETRPHHAPGAAGPKQAVYGAKNDGLEALIVEGSGEPESYLKYADWLQRQGDPLGELIVIQEALARKPSETLKRSESRLLSAHGDYFYGGLSDEQELMKVGWELGFMCSAVLFLSSLKRRELDGESLLRSFLSSPSTKLLRSLAVIKPSDDWEVSYDSYLKVLIEVGIKPLLTKLQIGSMNSSGSVRVTDDLLSIAPRLKDLALFGGTINLASTRLSGLESLILSGTITAACIRRLGEIPWPRLASLTLDINHYVNDFSYLEPLFASDMPSLQSLAFRHLTLGDEICLELSRSPLSSQLVTLVLSNCRVTEEGVRTLADSMSHFDSLKVLDLSGNGLDSALLEGLSSAIDSFTIEHSPPYESFGERDSGDAFEGNDDEYEYEDFSRREYGHDDDDDEHIRSIDDDWEDRDDPYDIDED